MTKTRVPASIDEKNHQRIKQMIKTHPELNYKKITGFVNEALEEKLDKIDRELVDKSIKNVGLESFITNTKMEIDELKKKMKRYEAMISFTTAVEMKRIGKGRLSNKWKKWLDNTQKEARIKLIETTLDDPEYLKKEGTTREETMKLLKELKDELKK